MVRGEKKIEVDDQVIILKVGESLRINKGSRVRYSNPFETDAEYWSICYPAFTLSDVNREEES